MPYGGANYVIRRNGHERERFNQQKYEDPQALVARVEAGAIDIAQQHRNYEGDPSEGTSRITVESVGLTATFTLVHDPREKNAHLEHRWVYPLDNTVHPSLLEAERHVFETYDV